MAEWTHNICERDWFINPKFSAHSSGGFRQPTQIRDPDGEPTNGICCVCGVPTVSGIFVRSDPNEMLCKGDHENPDMWSPILGSPVVVSTPLVRDDDYTPEAINRTQE